MNKKKKATTVTEKKEIKIDSSFGKAIQKISNTNVPRKKKNMVIKKKKEHIGFGLPIDVSFMDDLLSQNLGK